MKEIDNYILVRLFVAILSFQTETSLGWGGFPPHVIQHHLSQPSPFWIEKGSATKNNWEKNASYRKMISSECDHVSSLSLTKCNWKYVSHLLTWDKISLSSHSFGHCPHKIPLFRAYRLSIYYTSQCMIYNVYIVYIQCIHCIYFKRYDCDKIKLNTLGIVAFRAKAAKDVSLPTSRENCVFYEFDVSCIWFCIWASFCLKSRSRSTVVSPSIQN